MAPSFTILWSGKMLVYKKQFIKTLMFLLAKASLSIILHSPVEINHLQVKTLQNSSTYVYFERGHQELTFSLEDLLWIMESFLVRNEGLKIKCLNYGCVSSQDNNYGLDLCRFHVDYCDVFIRCLDSVLMGPIHCRGCIGVFLVFWANSLKGCQTMLKYLLLPFFFFFFLPSSSSFLPSFLLPSSSFLLPSSSFLPSIHLHPSGM